MPDVFIEYLVKRKNTIKLSLAKVGIGTAAVAVAFAALAFSGLLGDMFSMLGPIAAAGAVYGAYLLITSLSIEFEYIVTNGEMDVDKIIYQRKRKRLVTVKCREAEAFGRYKPEEHAGKNYQTRIIACDSPDSDDIWYFTSRIKDKGLTLVVFNANEKMLTAIKPFLPKPIMHSVFRIGAK